MDKTRNTDKLYLLRKLGELHYEYMQKWYKAGENDMPVKEWESYVYNEYTPKEVKLYKQIQESEAHDG